MQQDSDIFEINDRLLYYPTFLKHKCKQRLTKLTQYLIRSRRLMLAPGPKTVTRMAPKKARREETRERKALAAAKLEKEIERELVNRLKSGNYTEDMLNVNEKIWKKVLDQRARAERGEEEVEEEEEDDDEEEEAEMESNGKRRLVTNGSNKRRRIVRVEVEYEEEHENHP